MENKRLYTPNKRRTRNLSQYNKMSDEDFDDFWDEKYGGEEIDDHEILEELKVRIQEKLNELEKDYDFSDMKANDIMQLESLILAMLQLDDLEKEVYKRRSDISDTNILTLEKLNKIMSQLRADISTISTDLQLTKKIRNKSKDISIVQRWNELAKKASVYFSPSVTHATHHYSRAVTVMTLRVRHEMIDSSFSIAFRAFDTPLAMTSFAGFRHFYPPL